MEEKNLSGKEIEINELFMKPPIYKEIKDIIDNYYDNNCAYYHKHKIDLFGSLEQTVVRCIIIALFEKYGNLTEISKNTRLDSRAINKHIVKCGLESVYGANHIGGKRGK